MQECQFLSLKWFVYGTIGFSNQKGKNTMSAKKLRVTLDSALYYKLAAQAASRHCNLASFIATLSFDFEQRNPTAAPSAPKPAAARKVSEWEDAPSFGPKPVAARKVSEWEEEDEPVNAGD